jgi:hypothetical protein
MFGEKAYLLIKELDRNRESLPPYNVRCCTSKIRNFLSICQISDGRNK